MKKLAILSALLFSIPLFADAIEVTPSTLDFGNVVMGNTPTMSFTITSDLTQNISWATPSFYETDLNEVFLAQDSTQVVNVTFSPPSVGNYNSSILLTGNVFGEATVNVNATAVNDLSGSISGVITAEYSPYEISGNISVEEGNTLVIEPGVVLQFNEGTKFDIYGTLIAQGNPDQLISFEPLKRIRICNI